MSANSGEVQPHQIDEDLVPVRGPWVHAVEVDGEAVLLDEDRNRLHMLNPTATILWACFDGRSRIADIVTDISEELGLAHDDVLADTLALTRNLGEQGLLANVARDLEVEDQGLDPRPDEPPDTEAEDCDEDPVEEEPPEDPRFIAQPPNP